MSVQKDMTEGKPIGLIIRFAIPMFIGTVFQQLYNMVDSIVVGRFVGADALAAVGACAPSYSLIIALVMGLATGSSVIISQAFGSGDRKRTKSAYFSSLIVIFVTGVILTVVGLLVAVPLLKILGTPEVLIDDCKHYLWIMCIGIVATCLYNAMAGFLRAVGNSVIPLVALIIASIINVILDIFFVLVLGMGVPGVAVATILAQLVSGLYCLIYIECKMPQYHIQPKEFEVEKDMMTEMIRIGAPAALSSSIVSISTMFLQKAVNAYGTDVIAAYTAGNRTEQICFCLSFAIGSAVGTFCGQNVGAKRLDRVIQGLHAGYIITLAYNIVVGAAAFIGAKYVLMIFTTDANVIRIGIGLVRVTTLFAPVLGMVFVYQNFLRNVSDVKPTVWMSLAEVVARGCLGFVFSALFGYAGIWWATPVGWTGSMLIGYVSYRSGRWKERV
ncbi:MAG: MATE family efflux transporter [Hespellia sp.]|nr:MATE family efflux transporter [Hespellia sp.]